MTLARRYSLTSTSHIRNFATKAVFENEKAKLFCDQHIHTDIKLQSNKPDLLLIDKAKNFALIIEIGISSPQDLVLRESEKYRKYELLGDEVKAIYKLRKVEVISLVFSWDGLVTRRNKFFTRKLGLSQQVVAYIQYKILKCTQNIYLKDGVVDQQC